MYLLAIFIITVSDAIFKSVSDSTGISTWNALMVRSLIGLSLAAPCVLFTGRTLHSHLNTKVILIDLIRLIALVSSIYLWLTALRAGNFGRAYAICQLSPAMIILLLVLFYKQAISIKESLALFFCFCGSFLIISPTVSTSISRVDLLCLGSVFLWAVFNIAQSKLSKLVSVFSQCVTTSLFYIFTSFLLSPNLSQLLEFDIYQWLVLFCWSVLNFIATLLFSGSMKFSPLSYLAPFEHMSVLFSVSISYLYFLEPLTLKTWSGLFILVSSSLFILIKQYMKLPDLYIAPTPKNYQHKSP